MVNLILLLDFALVLGFRVGGLVREGRLLGVGFVYGVG